MKFLFHLSMIVTSVALLASCGQTSTTNDNGRIKVQDMFSNPATPLLHYGANEVPGYLDKNPSLKANLEQRGILDDVLRKAERGAGGDTIQGQALQYCSVFYGPDVYENPNGTFLPVGGSAQANCSKYFEPSSVLDVVLTRDPLFARTSGEARAGLFGGNSLQAYTNPDLPYITRQRYCVNYTIFIAFPDGSIETQNPSNPSNCYQS